MRIALESEERERKGRCQKAAIEISSRKTDNPLRSVRLVGNGQLNV